MTFRHIVPDVAPGGPGAPAGTAVAAAPAETVDAEIPDAGPALRRCRLDGVIDYQRGSVTNSIAIHVVHTYVNSGHGRRIKSGHYDPMSGQPRIALRRQLTTSSSELCEKSEYHMPIVCSCRGVVSAINSSSES